jgi:hypothetical protein
VVPPLDHKKNAPMTSFLVSHKELHRFAPSQNPAEKAPLAGLKEAGRLLPRPWITRTKPSRLGLAQGSGLVRRGWLSVFSTLAIGCVWLAAPLRAQFAYVANFNGGTISAYSIAANGALVPVPGSPFAAGGAPSSVAVDPTGKSPTWQTLETTSRPTASLLTGP